MTEDAGERWSAWLHLSFPPKKRPRERFFPRSIRRLW